MRVALCLSGQARGFYNCWNSFIENIIKPTKCDIFVSFANDDSLTGLFKTKNFGCTELEFIKDPSLEYLYSIAKGDITYCQHTGIMGKECTNLAVLRQFYFINRANNMKIDYENRNSFVYDWVIRSRADLVIKDSIGDLGKLDNRKIYIPAEASSGGYNDHFAFGSSENMNIYSDRIGEIKKISSPPYPFFNPHKELQYILDDVHNIEVEKIPMIVERDRKWRGRDNRRILKYYGKYGEEVLKKIEKREGKPLDKLNSCDKNKISVNIRK